MPKRRKSRARAATLPHTADAPLNPAFAGLKGALRELQREQRQTAAAATRQREEEQRQQADAAWLRRQLGGVVPLAPTGRIEPRSVAPRPLPLQRWADDDAVLRESLSDDYGAEWLLETDESLSFRRQGLGADVVRKLRRGHWAITAQLDLHGLRVDEAREALADFLRECVRSERRCVRIIHGKGLGSVNRTPVLKEKVRRWLTQKDEVLAFVEARPNDGGAGVVLALLQKTGH
ncbi:MAG: Smr/MutS family protein [Pigmentiphaga sp.]|nr:Smr/MutS family protein [Pigmentiphaga sp.]